METRTENGVITKYMTAKEFVDKIRGSWKLALRIEDDHKNSFLSMIIHNEYDEIHVWLDSEDDTTCTIGFKNSKGAGIYLSDYLHLKINDEVEITPIMDYANFGTFRIYHPLLPVSRIMVDIYHTEIGTDDKEALNESKNNRENNVGMSPNVEVIKLGCKE
ncbi:hypothetical protein FACS1894191_4320 [Clostridia bacterium]|nr:hypothetical protein FACS1894191_4320 [Clostridia bacterium]